MKNTGSPFIDGLLCARHLPSRNLSSEQGTLTSKQMTLRDGSEFCSGRRAIEQHMQSRGVGWDGGVLEERHSPGTARKSRGAKQRKERGKCPNDHREAGRCQRMKGQGRG